ncbi:hypothetical protein F0562_003871 [Nyssa sinensis]|uniref:TF-B3 domain-containing protein n=1 Tax=Nyssa sinensis TaxID=561372 RepID=A0A5J5BW48_9ASTE|nr:hypothetical protein F0562_003871 [Nyssa sinensis]
MSALQLLLFNGDTGFTFNNINLQRIPPAFLQKNFKEKIPENITLKTHTGKSWDVKVAQIDGHDYFFAHYGWRKFVEDHKLQVGDFLVFWLISDSTFDVVTYDRSGCEKEVNSAIRGNIGDASTIFEHNNENPLMGIRRTARGRKPKASLHDVKMKNDESEGMVKAAGSVKAIQPSFVGILKKYNRYIMNLPLGFARETGMITKKSTVLRDPEGRLWPVIIRATRNNGSVGLGVGWSEFQRANKLADGNKCLFRFIQNAGNVIEVQILHRGKRLPGNRYRLLS